MVDEKKRELPDKFDKMNTEEDNFDGDFDLDLGELTIELDDDDDDLDSDWDDEESDWDEESQPPQPQSLKDFAGDWENRWAEWKWMDDHNR